MTTDLNETRLQVLFLPVNVYIEDKIIVSRLESNSNKQMTFSHFFIEK